MNPARKENLLNYGMAALSGLMLTLSFPPFGLWPLVWLALAPLWITVLRAPDIKTAANLGAAAGLVFYSISLYWMVKIFKAAAPGFWCVFALWIVLHSVLIRRLWESIKKRGRGTALPLLWVLLAGIMWSGIEYFRSEIWFLACPWLGLGYSQPANSPLLQSLSVWGVFGLSAFIASVNAAWTMLFHKHKLPAAVFACAIALATAFGLHRQNTLNPETGKPVKAALVQDESSDVNNLIKLSVSPEARDADLLVWPEYSFFMMGGGENIYLRLFEKKLRPSKATVSILGAGIPADKKEKRRGQNFALLLNADKKPAGRYDKLHPVPYVDLGLVANPDPAPVPSALGKLGIQICYDLNFEDGARKVAGKGARLLITPAMDPLSWGAWQHSQHSAMSAARTVESGLWLARATTSGISQIIDPLGKVRAALETGRAGVLSGTVYLNSGGTFYTRFGWLLAPLALIVTGLAAIWLIIC